jgi:hypothetical protein
MMSADVQSVDSGCDSEYDFNELNQEDKSNAGGAGNRVSHRGGSRISSV